MPLLEVIHMTHYFGGLRAVHDFNLAIEKGEIRGLIGPNGAGKSTVFNLITGIYHPTEGQVLFNGQSIVNKHPYQIADMGLGRTFQNLRLWRHMTVLEHVKMARYSKLTYGLIGAFFETPKRRREEAESEEIARNLLDLLGVYEVSNELVTNLPYGMQRKVEIVRALSSGPKLLLLDEPAAGLQSADVNELIELIRWIFEQFDISIWMIEHQMKVVMTLCSHISVIDFGRLIAQGTPDEIQNNPEVIKAYLGDDNV